MKLTKLFMRVHPKSFGFGLLAGCVLVSLVYVSVDSIASDMVHLAISNIQPSSWKAAASAIPTSGKNTSSLEQSNPILKNDSVAAQVAAQERSLKSENNSDEDLRPADPTKPICDFSNARTDVCDIYGDIRIVGKHLSTVMVVSSPQVSEEDRNRTWQLRPYPRKWSDLSNVRQVKVQTLLDPREAPACSVNHAVPAVVFSESGLAGNYFHAFIEVLVPLFETAGEFHGQVQLMVTDYIPPWIEKYRLYLKKLSQYEIIDYDGDDRVHCFKRAIVGLRFDGELIIDPARSPNGYSMVDFAEFMRSTYSLGRDRPSVISKETQRRPRLLIIARSKNRKFMNLDELVRLAESVGFEAVVSEGDPDVAKFARIVNSCDAMLGVHGSGLTNSVFLPTNAVLIQVVPYGKLDWLAKASFADPAKNMKLRYLEYSITAEESSLIDEYPRDDPVIKDPESLHRQGWGKMSLYLTGQDVKLDLRRFRPLLDQAFELLHKTEVE